MAGVRESPYEPGLWFVEPEPGSTRQSIGSTQWQCGPRYALHRVLGYGSFSTVCLARDAGTGELVALKRIPDVLHSPEQAKRVLREVGEGRGRGREHLPPPLCCRESAAPGRRRRPGLTPRRRRRRRCASCGGCSTPTSSPARTSSCAPPPRGRCDPAWDAPWRETLLLLLLLLASSLGQTIGCSSLARCIFPPS